MSENIRFSVLIPVYNVESYICECVDSVLNQSYQNFEVIIIDDGSTDNSGEICQSYSQKDCRIKTFHQNNQGLIFARRNAISKAKGEYCLFLDSDDYWNSDLLESVNNAIKNYECDLIIFKYLKVSNNKELIFESKGSFLDKTIFEDESKIQLFEKIITSTELNNLVCKAVKRTIIDDADYSQYKDIKNAEDLLQTLPLIYNAKRIIYLDKPMYNYRSSINSITQTLNLNLYNDITIVRKKLFEYMVKLGIDNVDNKKKFFHFYIYSILNYIKSLIFADIPIEDKISIFLQIKRLCLYLQALEHIDINKLSISNRIVFILFSRNCYRLLLSFKLLISLIYKMNRYCSKFIRDV